MDYDSSKQNDSENSRDIKKILSINDFELDEVIGEISKLKNNAIKNSVLNLVSQIKKRQAIKKSKIGMIESDIKKWRIELLQLQELQSLNYMLPDPFLIREKNSIKRMIGGLEREMIEEELRCWKDALPLEGELTNLINFYISRK